MIRERTSRPEHARGFVGGNYSETAFPLESMKVLLLTPWIAIIGETIAEDKATLIGMVVVESGHEPQLNHHGRCM